MDDGRIRSVGCFLLFLTITTFEYLKIYKTNWYGSSIIYTLIETGFAIKFQFVCKIVFTKCLNSIKFLKRLMPDIFIRRWLELYASGGGYIG